MDAISKEIDTRKIVYAVVSFYVGLVFGCLAVVFVRDSFLVSRVLVLPILGEFNDDDYVIDSWYQSYRKDMMPDASGRIFKAKSVQRRVDVPVRNFEYVGKGDVTNPNKCGVFVGWGGCLRHDPIWAYKIFNSCDSPKCSICYRSWASRLVGSVEPRLVAASEVYGDLEHVMVSLRKEDHDLSYKQMKAKCIRLLKSCSIHSGYMLLHGKSFGKYRPHFHVLCWIGAVGGAERCRYCGSVGKDCYPCNGIYGILYRAWVDSGYIIKVLPKRITIRGTIFYEAEHCTIDYSKRRFRVGVWFGKVAYSNYSRLGVKFEKARLQCPECGSVCGRIDYLGDREFVLDRDSRDFVRASFEPYREDDKIVWVVHESFKPRGGDDL